MQLETVLTDSLSVKDSLTIQKTNYIQSIETPYIPPNIGIKTNYDSLISISLLITSIYIFHYIHKKGKE